MTDRPGPETPASESTRPANGERAGDRSDDAALLELFRRYRATGEESVRDELVIAHRWIAAHAARRFANRGEPLDDLVQVGSVGLIKAVERFDPELGHGFVSFAMPTIRPPTTMLITMMAAGPAMPTTRSSERCSLAS